MTARRDRSPTRRYYAVNGIVVAPDTLVKLGDGRYAEPQLVRCVGEDQHDLRTPGSALIGWISCPSPHRRDGHRTTTCKKCAAIDYNPPLDEPECACQQRTRQARPGLNATLLCQRRLCGAMTGPVVPSGRRCGRARGDLRSPEARPTVL
ncbi:hypothetical protein JK358_38180 [Nocardia sp. 2]|uniref:Uncharacterized protein n=1 Tax=Nocardia acididurans TaxID=2802282 RepID=A0ABS1MHU4_9NOCA|nr:hypothetical protein [Nocardia acididurans]MBL1080240.1 hypothetical protein [Nocardia acididurans]